MHSILQIALLFDVSGGEFLIILLFILIFFGSKNIPDLARGLGRGYRQLKDATNNIKKEIQTGANDITGGMNEQIKRPLDQHFNDIKSDIDKNMKDIDKDMDEELNK